MYLKVPYESLGVFRPTTKLLVCFSQNASKCVSLKTYGDRHRKSWTYQTLGILVGLTAKSFLEYLDNLSMMLYITVNVGVSSAVFFR